MIIVSLVLKLVGLGLVVGAAGLWAASPANSRPKNRDEQTLVGGAIWAQILIPIGLILSAIVDNRLDSFVYAYYLFSGCVLLAVTGIILIVGESRKLKKPSRTRLSVTLSTDPPPPRRTFDKNYFAIGVLLSLAAVVTFADFVLAIIFG